MERPSQVSRPGDPRGALSLRAVLRRFGPTRGVLGSDGGGVSLEVAAGSLLALTGPSGCGKSTLLRLIAGLDRPDGGTIHIDGRDVTQRPPHERGVGMTFDDGALYEHLSVGANIAVAAEAAGVRGREAIEAAAAQAGIGGLLDRRPATLSAGERRRAALARALARRPALLLLDEPLTHLDRAARLDLREDLARAIAASGSTAIVVTHDHDDAIAIADRIAYMSHGALVQVGPSTELIGRPAHVAVARGFGPEPMNVLAAADGYVGVRPSDCVLGTGPWTVSGVVRFARGGERTVWFPEGGRLRLKADAPIGATLSITAPPEALHRFDPAGWRVPESAQTPAETPTRESGRER